MKSGSKSKYINDPAILRVVNVILFVLLFLCVMLLLETKKSHEAQWRLLSVQAEAFSVFTPIFNSEEFKELINEHTPLVHEMTIISKEDIEKLQDGIREKAMKIWSIAIFKRNLSSSPYNIKCDLIARGTPIFLYIGYDYPLGTNDLHDNAQDDLFYDRPELVPINNNIVKWGPNARVDAKIRR